MVEVVPDGPVYNSSNESGTFINQRYVNGNLTVCL